MDERTKLKRALTDLRIRSGHTQSDLASMLGYSNGQFISNWERGMALPPIPTLFPLAKIFDVSADFLFNLVLAATLEAVHEQLLRRFNEEKG